MTFPWLVLGALGAAVLAVAAARATRQHLLAAVAGGGVILFLHAWLYFGYTSDDAYISYRYSRNLSDGLGLVWNPGEHVEGYSNFLWVMILAGFDALGADIVFTGRWLGFAFALGALAGTYVVTQRIADGAGGQTAGLLATLLLAAAGPFALWSTAGLEVSLFAALIVLGVWLHLREHAGMHPPVSGVVWAAASMTRPEGPILFAVSAVFKLIQVLAAGRGASILGGTRAVFRESGWMFVWAAGFAVVFVPYFAWRWATYDYFFPNTYYAKVGSGIDQYDRGLRYVATFTREYAAWLLLLAPIAAIVAPARKRLDLMYPATMLLVWTAYVAYVGGDSLVRLRFFAPVMPLLYITAASSVAWIIAALEGPRFPSRARDAVVGLGAAGLLVFSLQASSHDPNVGPEGGAVKDRAEIGRWLRANVPADTVIAVIPAGAIPYESGLPTIDMLGINDEHIAHTDRHLGALAAGHEKYNSDYVLDRAPDIIIIEDVFNDRAWAREDYGKLIGGLIPARIDMLSNERLWREYQPRGVEVKEGEWFNLLVRPDASAVLARTQPPEAP